MLTFLLSLFDGEPRARSLLFVITGLLYMSVRTSGKATAPYRMLHPERFGVKACALTLTILTISFPATVRVQDQVPHVDPQTTRLWSAPARFRSRSRSRSRRKRDAQTAEKESASDRCIRCVESTESGAYSCGGDSCSFVATRGVARKCLRARAEHLCLHSIPAPAQQGEETRDTSARAVERFTLIPHLNRSFGHLHRTTEPRHFETRKTA